MPHEHIGPSYKKYKLSGRTKICRVHKPKSSIAAAMLSSSSPRISTKPGSEDCFYGMAFAGVVIREFEIGDLKLEI
jgi:hypothetical protein